MLSVWQLLPLFYFTFLCFKINEYFYQLAMAMQRFLCSTSTNLTIRTNRDLNLRERSSTFYYNWYSRLTDAVIALGAFTTFYMFVSLALSVMIGTVV